MFGEILCTRSMRPPALLKASKDHRVQRNDRTVDEGQSVRCGSSDAAWQPLEPVKERGWSATRKCQDEGKQIEVGVTISVPGSSRCYREDL